MRLEFQRKIGHKPEKNYDTLEHKALAATDKAFGIFKEFGYKLLSKRERTAVFNGFFKQQSGCCAICGKHKKQLKGGFLELDHNHKTDKVRGLLCKKCNVGLGMFLADDGVSVLEKAIAYIQKSHQHCNHNIKNI